MSVDVNSPEFVDAVKAAVQTQVDEVAGGLKTKNQELLGEVKDLKTKLKKFDGFDIEEYETLKLEKRNKVDKDSDPAQLRQRIEGEFAPKLTEAEGRATAAEKKLSELMTDSALTAALSEVGVAKEFLRAVKADLVSSRKVEVKEDGVLIDGKQVADFVKGWATADGKAFIAARDNNGGGGKGGAGGAGTGKKASEMTLAEKTAFIKENGRKVWEEKITKES